MKSRVQQILMISLPSVFLMGPGLTGAQSHFDPMGQAPSGYVRGETIRYQYPPGQGFVQRWSQPLYPSSRGYYGGGMPYPGAMWPGYGGFPANSYRPSFRQPGPWGAYGYRVPRHSPVPMERKSARHCQTGEPAAERGAIIGEINADLQASGL